MTNRDSDRITCRRCIGKDSSSVCHEDDEEGGIRSDRNADADGPESVLEVALRVEGDLCCCCCSAIYLSGFNTMESKKIKSSASGIRGEVVVGVGVLRGRWCGAAMGHGV